MGIISSPFEAAGTSPIGMASGWLGSLVTGSLAVALCIVAVAVLGFLLFGGRLPIRAGVRTILGCFVLLGAPLIAAGLMGLSDDGAGQASSLPRSASETRAPLPEASYDPYAGASFRQD